MLWSNYREGWERIANGKGRVEGREEKASKRKRRGGRKGKRKRQREMEVGKEGERGKNRGREGKEGKERGRKKSREKKNHLSINYTKEDQCLSPPHTLYISTKFQIT